jgi:hypothetical protein
MRDNDRLKVSAEPDGFGFYYGWAERDGERAALLNEIADGLGRLVAAGPAQRTSLPHFSQQIPTPDQVAPNPIRLEPSGYTAAPSRGKFSHRLGGQLVGGSYGYIRCACHVQRAGH